jgi:hypothetical protein
MKKNHIPFLLLNVSVFILQLFVSSANAQWSADPNVNNAICTAVNDQIVPGIVSDNAGGAIIVWTDYRNGATNADIFAQRIDSNGIIQWTADGIVISAAANDQSYPTIMNDGSGGAIIAWNDLRSGTNYDIYAQRIDSNGSVQWDIDGVEVSTSANYQINPTIVGDENGGAIIIWQDKRSGINYDIYAQRIGVDGTAQWTANGVVICTEVGPQDYPMLVSDGNGGAISTWNDHRSGNNDIYAQLINSNGEARWTNNGVEICTADWEQSFVTLVNDGIGGAIFAWQDYRSSPVTIYAQRIDTGGVVQWTADGIPISALAYAQVSPDMLSDGSGGAIIAWQVNSTSNDYDIYAQHIAANGTLQWTVNGKAVCTAGHHQQDPAIISDGNGGVIVTWEDQRSGTNYDIYAQHIDTSGSVHWAANGVAISTAMYDQIYPAEVSDGKGGAVITWQDYRVAYPDSVDIYAQKVNANGSLGSVSTGVEERPTVIPDFNLAQNTPNPFNKSTTIKYELSHRQMVSLKVYDVFGNEIVTLVNGVKPSGNYEVSYNASSLTPGIYFYQLQADNFVETKKMILSR